MDAPPPSSSALFARPAFTRRYLRVCEQLDALQPVSITAHQRGASDRDGGGGGGGGGSAPSRSIALPSRERIAELFATNERFRPAEEVRALSNSSSSKDASAPPIASSLSPTTTSRTPRMPTSPVSPAGARHVRLSVVTIDASEAAKRDAKAQASAAVHVPVGGRARILPSQALQRAKAALRKRSNALVNLQPTTTGGLAPDKRRALHNAPDSTWEVLRQALTPAGAHTRYSTSGTPSGQSQQQAPGKQALIAELVHKTHFSTQSIFQMSRKFKLIAGASKSVISFDEFRQIMSEDVGDLLVSIGVLGAAADADPSGDDSDSINVLSTAPPPQTPDMTAIGATISSSETFLRRLFLTFDVDGDGKIDFREFVVGLNGFVKGTPEEKVHALFEIYKSDDASENETVAISDLLGLFQGDRHLYQELMRCVDEYFARVELRDELQPTMTEDEFVAASVAEPHLLDMVSRPVPSRRYASEAHVRDKVRAFIEQKKLNWKKLLAIHRRMVDSTRSLAATDSLRSAVSRQRSSMSSRSALTSPPTTPTRVTTAHKDDSDAANNVETLAIPVAAFHKILTACLGPTPSGALDDEALTQSILLAYVATPREKLSTPQQQPTRSSVATPSADDALESERRDKPVRRASIVEHYVAHVSCGELSQDIAVALQTALTAEHDADSKARYYFELYDQDGDGLLSRNELCTAICAGFGHFGQSMMDVVRVLEDEDADQDGEVTKDEYMRAASKSPLILASLYTCLQREV